MIESLSPDVRHAGMYFPGRNPNRHRAARPDPEEAKSPDDPERQDIGCLSSENVILSLLCNKV